MKKLIGIFICLIAIVSMSFNAFCFFEKMYNTKCDKCHEVKKCYFINVGSKEKKYPCLFYTYMCKDCYKKANAKNGDFKILKDSKYKIKITSDGRDMTNDWQDYFYKWVYSQNVGIGWGDITEKIPVRLAEKDNVAKGYANLAKALQGSGETDEVIVSSVIQLLAPNDNGWGVRNEYTNYITKDELLSDNLEEALSKNKNFLKMCSAKKNENAYYKKYSDIYDELIKKEQEEEKKNKGKREFKSYIKKYTYYIAGSDGMFDKVESSWYDTKFEELWDKGEVGYTITLFNQEKAKPLKTEMTLIITKDLFENRKDDMIAEDYGIMSIEDRLERLQDLGKDKLVKVAEEKSNLTEKAANINVSVIMEAKDFDSEGIEVNYYPQPIGYSVCYFEDRLELSPYLKDNKKDNKVVKKVKETLKDVAEDLLLPELTKDWLLSKDSNKKRVIKTKELINFIQDNDWLEFFVCYKDASISAKYLLNKGGEEIKQWQEENLDNFTPNEGKDYLKEDTFIKELEKEKVWEIQWIFDEAIELHPTDAEPDICYVNSFSVTKEEKLEFLDSLYS